MSAPLFEQRDARGNVWRLEVSTFNGRVFGNWRRWFEKDGEVRPSKDGCTIPLERLLELQHALAAYNDQPHPDAGPDGP